MFVAGDSTQHVSASNMAGCPGALVFNTLQCSCQGVAEISGYPDPNRRLFYRLLPYFHSCDLHPVFLPAVITHMHQVRLGWISQNKAKQLGLTKGFHHLGFEKMVRRKIYRWGMVDRKTIKLKVYRFDPTVDKEARVVMRQISKKPRLKAIVHSLAASVSP